MAKPTSEEIRQIVLHIITSKQDEMFEQFDRLHRRDIHDNDMVETLRSLGEVDLLDQYAEWGEIDLREDDNTTTNPAVPDPADAPSYASHPLNQPKVNGLSPEGRIKELMKQLDYWEARGDTTAGIAYLRNHFGVTQ